MNELLHHTSFMPHGMCYLWQPDILMLHVVSDSFIALAYFTIPVALIWFARKRRDLSFNWMFVCFALFIIACGTTHLMEIVTIWTPVYWASGTVKAITALASVPTAFLLVKLIPDLLRVPNLAILRRELEVYERAGAEARKANEQLEARVTERTAQLEAVNQELRREARQRHEAEEKMLSNQQLLEGIADSAVAIIFAKDPEGRYLFTSRRFDLLLGLKRGEIIGGTDNVLFPAETADFLREVDRRAMAADSAITQEEVIPLSDGPHTYLTVKGALREADKPPYAIFGISVDITERKRADDERRAHLDRMELLERTTRAMGECTDLPAVYQAALQGLEEGLGVELAVVWERENHDEFMSAAAIGARSQPLAERLALVEQTKIAFQREGFEGCHDGELSYAPDLSTYEHRFPERLVRINLRSLVVAPLVVEGKVTGALMCARGFADGFTSTDCRFLESLARHLSLAVQHARRYQALQSAFDELQRPAR